MEACHLFWSREHITSTFWAMTVGPAFYIAHTSDMRQYQDLICAPQSDSRARLDFLGGASGLEMVPTL